MDIFLLRLTAIYRTIETGGKLYYKLWLPLLDYVNKTFEIRKDVKEMFWNAPMPLMIEAPGFVDRKSLKIGEKPAFRIAKVQVF